MQTDDQFKTPEERLAKFKDIHEEVDNETNRTANDLVENTNEETATLSAQGGVDEKKDNLGGSTNLSLEQLKEGDEQPDNNE